MTSGTASEAPAVTGSTPQNGENKPPQAIVKPQVLTHVIEGFVIQEGAEPFPVCVSVRVPVSPQRAPEWAPAGGCQQANTSPLSLSHDRSQLLWDSVVNYTGHCNRGGGPGGADAGL